MVWPITVRESYVIEKGESMNAARLYSGETGARAFAVIPERSMNVNAMFRQLGRQAQIYAGIMYLA
jgi:hypothetical protein